MADSAGELTFTFGADFSGFSRAVDSAGHQLDQLSKATARWQSDAASALTQGAGRRPGAPLALTGGMARAAQAVRTPPAAAVASSDDATSTKELRHLADQLALLKTTGAEHDAIVLRMKTETEQAKLGTDATVAQKQSVAALVTQIDAAKTAQTALKTAQTATNEAWDFGADQIERGLEGMILKGGSPQDFARSLLTSFSRQGLRGALTGSGSLAGLFGTEGVGDHTGGLFGAIQSLFGGGLNRAGPGAGASLFSGLYANGGTIGAGQWGIAGERGAEIVAGPATVVPWNKLPVAPANGGTAMQQTINFNVTTPDAPSFARSETQMASLLSRTVGRGQRNA